MTMLFLETAHTQEICERFTEGELRTAFRLSIHVSPRPGKGLRDSVIRTLVLLEV